MYYKIYYLDHGKQESLPKNYSEHEYDRANKIVNELNKNRNKNDPYYWVAPLIEVVRMD